MAMTTSMARDILHDSKSKIARSLFGRVATCTNVTLEAPTIHREIELANNKGELTSKEYEALTMLCNDLIVSLNAVPLVKKNPIIETFKNRIWTNTSVENVMQFRNCVTDMQMLNMVTMEEYVALNNEIDSFIEYHLTNGASVR